MKLRLFIGICAFISVMLAHAFITWSVNPGSWSEGYRFSAVFFGFVIAVVAAANPFIDD